MQRRVGITAGAGRNGERPAQVLNTVYVDAVARAGATPLVLPILGADIAGRMLDGIDALVLSGGGDVDPARYGQRAVPEVYGVDPERDEWEIALVCAALDRAMPVLAICRGAQVLNVACGGTLVQDLASVTPTSHRDTDRSRELVHHVAIEPDSKLHNVLQVDALGVNTLHHQAVDDVGHGLQVVARHDEGTVEAIETIDDRPVLGVQWHPELLSDHALHRRLFSWIAGAEVPSKAC